MTEEKRYIQNTDVLVWLRKHAGYDVETVEEFGFPIRKCEAGELQPTSRDLRWLSRFYECSEICFYCSVENLERNSSVEDDIDQS